MCGRALATSTVLQQACPISHECLRGLAPLTTSVVWLSAFAPSVALGAQGGVTCFHVHTSIRTYGAQMHLSCELLVWPRRGEPVLVLRRLDLRSCACLENQFRGQHLELIDTVGWGPMLLACGRLVICLLPVISLQSWMHASWLSQRRLWCRAPRVMEVASRRLACILHSGGYLVIQPW